MIFALISLAALAITIGLYVVADLCINGPLYWCKWRHRRFHTLNQLEYGSMYYVTCSRCDHTYGEKRP